MGLEPPRPPQIYKIPWGEPRESLSGLGSIPPGFGGSPRALRGPPGFWGVPRVLGCPPSFGAPSRAAAPPQMTIHNLYIFDRAGTCLHYSEWHRRRQAGIPKEEVGGYGGL